MLIPCITGASWDGYSINDISAQICTFSPNTKKVPDCFLVNRSVIPLEYICAFLSKKGLLWHFASLSCHQVCAANFGEFCSIVGQEATEKLLVRALDWNPPNDEQLIIVFIIANQIRIYMICNAILYSAASLLGWYCMDQTCGLLCSLPPPPYNCLPKITSL